MSDMFKVSRKEIDWGGRKLVLETGKIARQADGAVLATTATPWCWPPSCREKNAEARPGLLPADRQLPGEGLRRRQDPGRLLQARGPADREGDADLAPDRPADPAAVPRGLPQRDPGRRHRAGARHGERSRHPGAGRRLGGADALAASPFLGPIAAARVGYINGEFMLNPTLEQTAESDARPGRRRHREAVMMVESEAKELTEESMLAAVMFGHAQFQPVIELIIELAEQAAPRSRGSSPSRRRRQDGGREAEALARGRPAPRPTPSRASRRATQKVDAVKDEAEGAVRRRATPASRRCSTTLFEELEADVVRGADPRHRQAHRRPRHSRPCARSRPRSACCRASTARRCSPAARPRRWCVATLGTGQDEQMIDALEGDVPRALHAALQLPALLGRRDRPHGLARPPRDRPRQARLARACVRCCRGKDEFPYTIRVVSEITETNGSSSMATVCGASLALMDAGVPLQRPVAGIAMGLIKEGDRFAVLSDILGDEDHLGDMDFKVAGTEHGVTALQMDIKIAGITAEIMQVALDQAQDGRLHILGEMAKALGGRATEMREHAPRITTINDPDRQDRRGDRPRRQDDPRDHRDDRHQDRHRGRRHGQDRLGRRQASQRAVDWIQRPHRRARGRRDLQGQGRADRRLRRLREHPRRPRRARAHLRARHERVGKVTDVVKEGDKVKVKVLAIDDRGKIRLSMGGRQVTGEEISRSSRGRRPPRPPIRPADIWRRKRRPEGRCFSLAACRLHTTFER